MSMIAWAAAAAVVAAEEPVVFTAGDFAAYAPRTALDIVARVPGFTIDNGGGGRGLGGATGNVLIDGAQPTSKSESLQDVLARIAVEQVERIELLRNGSRAAPGQPVVVNVVRSAVGGSGAYQVSLARNDDGRVTASAEASYSGRAGPGDYSIGVELPTHAGRFARTGYLYDANGVLTAIERDQAPSTYEGFKLTGNGSLPVGDGQFALSAQVFSDETNVNFETVRTTALGDVSWSRSLGQAFRNRGREISITYTQPAPIGDLRVVALDRLGTWSGDERSITRPAGEPVSVSLQQQRWRTQESVLRSSLARTVADEHDIQVAVEAARNTVRSTQTTATDGALSRLPGSSTAVEELRADLSLTHSFRFTPQTQLESSVGWETSEIALSGDAGLVRSFTFWKPSVQVSRDFGGDDQVRVRVARDVGQLNFGDFTSTVSAADGRVRAGNPALRPFTAWRSEAALDLRLDDLGVYNVVAFKEWVTDTPDLVPIAGADAPGNIGDGRILGLAVDATVPLGFIAGGLELVGEIDLEQSRVDDPVTKRERRFSGRRDADVNVELRQTLPEHRLTWGVAAEKRSPAEFFRLAEYERYEDTTRVTAYIETNALDQAKLRVYAYNLNNNEGRLDRRTFADSRTGAATGGLRRTRSDGVFLGMQVSGAF